MKTYSIMREGGQATDDVICRVRTTVADSLKVYEDYVLPLEPSLKIHNHSPTGFNFGYEGSGPAQLALAILLDFMGRTPTPWLYQEFKRKFIAPMKNPGGVITTQEIQDFINGWMDEYQRDPVASEI